MIKFMLILVFTFVLAGCSNNAPRQKPKPPEPYITLSTTMEAAANRLSVAIKVDPPITEASVKQAAEMVIDKYKADYKNIVVKSFTVSDASGIPYVTSYFDGQGVMHQVNPQAAPQKIPTH